MAARAARRQSDAEAADRQRQQEERERLIAAGILLPGEDYLMDAGPHKGHAVHGHESHGGAVVCQCGACLGLSCFVPDWDAPPPGPCPVCTARGIPLDR